METKQAVGESRVLDKGKVVVGSSGDDARVLVKDHDEDNEDGDWKWILTREFGKVDVVEKANATTKMGTSWIATTLQAAAAMMRLDRGWDWFMTLSASDYPLTTQDCGFRKW